MAYVYVCDACLDSRCETCEDHKDTPPKGMSGGGVCICGHVPNVYTPMEAECRQKSIKAKEVENEI